MDGLGEKRNTCPKFAGAGRPFQGARSGHLGPRVGGVPGVLRAFIPEAWRLHTPHLPPSRPSPPLGLPRGRAPRFPDPHSPAFAGATAAAARASRSPRAQPFGDTMARAGGRSAKMRAGGPVRKVGPCARIDWTVQAGGRLGRTERAHREERSSSTCWPLPAVTHLRGRPSSSRQSWGASLPPSQVSSPSARPVCSARGPPPVSNALRPSRSPCRPGRGEGEWPERGRGRRRRQRKMGFLGAKGTDPGP